MESRPPWLWAPPGPLPAPLPAPWLLGLLLGPWTLLTGGQSVAHTGPPILAALANKTVSFGCNIIYPYTPEFKIFTISYFYVNRQGQRSLNKPTGCQPSTGRENQTTTMACQVTPTLPSALATGTYYCSVHWPNFKVSGSGTFILVRDTGYREPSRVSQKVLLLSFIGILGALSVLITVLLLWKKKQVQKQVQVSWKQLAPKTPAPSPASPEQPPDESLYTALQRQDTEVYAYMQSEASGPPSRRTFLSQESPHRFQNEDEFNLVYENL